MNNKVEADKMLAQLDAFIEKHPIIESVKCKECQLLNGRRHYNVTFSSRNVELIMIILHPKEGRDYEREDFMPQLARLEQLEGE